MDSICRLCLHKNDLDVMKNVFEFSPQYFELNLTEILYWIFDVEIIVEDSYSKLVCYKCLKVIENIGRFRKFFQLNQTFLHERRCPDDYDVQSGWYNTRDIGTNTEYVKDPNCVKISVNDVNTQANVVKAGKSKMENINTQQDDKVIQADSIELVNVSVSTLEEFLKSKTTNKALERIDVPRSVFEYFSPEVNLPELNKECCEQGYAKMGKTYSNFNANNLYVLLRKVDTNRMLSRHYKKIGELTYKMIPKVRKRKLNCLKKKMQLLQDYYYSMPTSALRELITETSPRKNKQKELPITSLVTTNEVNVQVCGYCSRVFKFKMNLDQHVDRFHKDITPEESQSNLQNNKYMRKKRKLNFVRKTLNREQSSEFDLQTSSSENLTNNFDTLLVDNMKNKLDNILLVEDNKEQEGDSDVEVLKHVSLNEDEINVLDNIFNIESKVICDNSNDFRDNPLEVSSENTDSDSGSKSWLRVKDIKQLRTEQLSGEAGNGGFNIDYLKTVIFGKNSEANPTVTYHVADHDYAANAESETKTLPFQKRKKIHSRKFSKAKMAPDIVNVLEKRFDDIKKTREVLEKMKKLRFAIHNEIENCQIKSFISNIQDKLQVIRAT